MQAPQRRIYDLSYGYNDDDDDNNNVYRIVLA
jgi:hypothetical protein